MEVNYTFSVLSLQRLLEILERRHENHLRDDQCRVTTMSNTFILFYKSCFLVRPVSSWRCLPWTGGPTRSSSRPATPWTSSYSWSGSYSSTSWRCAASWSPPSTNKFRYGKYVYPSISLSGWNAEIQKAFITFVRGQAAESAGVSSDQVHTNTRYLVSTYLHLATACWVTCHGVMSVDCRCR